MKFFTKPYDVLAVLVMFATAFSFGKPSIAADSGPEPVVRVLISSNQAQAKLTVMGNYKIAELKSGKVLSQSRALMRVNVRPTAEGLQVAGVAFPDGIAIESSDVKDLYINDQPFRGKISVHKAEDGTLLIVNHIPLEAYLYGVLYHEVGEWWPAEALKSQAVASRTYAMDQIEQRKSKLFDVYNNQSSQMYGGADSERHRSNQAVDDTRGEVLVWKGKIFPAFYHATCGGMTRDASELWNTNIPPLDGKVKCTTCWFSPHYEWSLKMTSKEFQQILVDRNVWVGGISDISVTLRSPSGHALEVTLHGPNGEKVLSAKDLRLWVGPTTMRSENFEVKMSGGEVVFHGKGWGHGVGMCQWGTLGQAIMRRSYKDILLFYYPSAEIKKVY